MPRIDVHTWARLALALLLLLSVGCKGREAYVVTSGAAVAGTTAARITLTYAPRRSGAHSTRSESFSLALLRPGTPVFPPTSIACAAELAASVPTARASFIAGLAGPGRFDRLTPAWSLASVVTALGHASDATLERALVLSEETDRGGPAHRPRRTAVSPAARATTC